MMPSLSLSLLVLVGVASPAILLTVLGCASLLNRPLPERLTGRIAAASLLTSCAALTAAFVLYGATEKDARLISFGSWSSTHEGGIAIEFLVDRLSLAFAALS